MPSTKDGAVILTDCNEVGNGTYGVVLVGKAGGRQYATKRRYIPVSGAPEGCIHLSEVDALCRFSSPYVLHADSMQRNSPVKDGFRSSSKDTFGCEDGQKYRADLVYLLTAAAEGDLNRVSLCGGRITESNKELLQAYMRQIVLGIAHIHMHGFIHRDLKPSNVLHFQEILLCSPEEVSLKICDFDMCIRDIPGYMSGKAMTPEFTPPEVFEQGSDVTYTKAVDIWGIGHMLYNLVHGTPLFRRNGRRDTELDDYCVAFCNRYLPDGNRNHELVLSHNFGDSDISLDLGDPDATDFLQQCLSCDPFKRPTIQQCLSHPFLGCKVPDPLPAPDHMLEKPHLSEDMIQVFEDRISLMSENSWFGFFLGLDILMRMTVSSYRGKHRDLAICCYNLGMKYFDKENAFCIPMDDKEAIKRVEYRIVAEKLHGIIYRDTVYSEIQEEPRKIFRYLTCPDIYPCRFSDLVESVRKTL